MLRMTFEQLRVFVAVAERQHVTRAAEAINLSQSAVSSAIAALENQYQIKLFSRIGRRIELTDAGLLFIGEAKAVLARAKDAEATLLELGTLRRGRLKVFASQTISSYWLPRHLVAFHVAHADVDIRLDIGNSAQAASAVQEGFVDFALVEGVVDQPELASHRVAKDQMIIVVGAQHPWAERTEASPAELTEISWILREPGSGTRSEFERALDGHGLTVDKLRVALELPSNESVRAAVEAGLGATALSSTVAAPGIEAGLLHHIRFRLPERDFCVLLHKERQRSFAANAFLSLLGLDQK